MYKPLAAIAVAAGLAVPFGAALAQPVSVRIETPEIGIRIGHPLPHLHVPAPVVIAPPPVVYAPPPRVIVAPPPVVYYPVPPYYRAYDKGHWHKHRWHKHHWRGYHDHRWDDDDDRRGRRHRDWD